MTSVHSLIVLIIEDNDSLREALVDVLQREGHMCMGLACAEDVEDSVQQTPDLYLIDLNLPGEDGFSLARRIRASQPDAAIILLTAMTDINDRLQGYETGADLYLTKPIHPSELCSIVKALARRIKGNPDMTSSSIRLNTGKSLLSGPLGEITLTHSELKLIEALARAPGQTLQSWQVATHLGQSESLPSKASVEVRLSRVRKKMVDVGAPSSVIKAIKGYGYRLNSPINISPR